MKVSVPSRLLAGACTLAVGLIGGRVLATPFHVELGEKRLDGLEWSEPGAATTPGPKEGPGDLPPSEPGRGTPLPIRMVDMGGVGIPADTAEWGTSYSHATHAFDQLILDREPWLDPEKAREIREDWQGYLARMAGMGSNAVILDLFLELVNFDTVGSGADVYPAGHPLRPRHRAFRAFARELTRDAADRGLDVYLKTDLPTVTPPVRRYLAALPEGDDPSAPAFWALYAAAVDEIFTTVPGVAGVVVRVGEAGPLYNVAGLDYSSYMGVREPGELQQMLRTLLPVFEEHGRTLIFRSWSVGVGALGALHNDPRVYDAVLGPVQSPALVVSTKFVQGDYFGFLPLNPTLLVGDHRRLIEYQARREYEGFGALPNYLGHAHGVALRRVLAANPHVVGTSTWTQEGGPLRTGPLSLYDVEGFWRWSDANVYATTRLALDPGADPGELAREWARLTFGDDPEVAASLGELLLTSREAMEKGFYIRPYAAQRMAIVGVDVPPLLWVFEWDVVGGWSSVLASLYRSVADDIDTPIAEGWEAVALTASMRERLEALAPLIGDHPDYRDMLASLDYQSSLFNALADFRESFLRYYAWLDRGGDPEPWQAATRRFHASAEAHLSAYRDDLDFPALDFEPALAATRAALAEGRRTMAARALAVFLLGTMLLGGGLAGARMGSYPGMGTARRTWLAATRPDRLTEAAAPGAVGATGSTVAALALVWAGILAGVALLLPGSGSLIAGLAAIGVAYSIALALCWTRRPAASGAGGGRGTRDGRRPPWAEAVAATTPLVWVALAVLLVTGVRGPGYLWFHFWTSDLFRGLLFAVLVGTACWALFSSFWLGRIVTGGGRWFAGGSVAAALGVALVVTSGLLPDLEGLLAALDEPLRLLPMRRALINGITHYAGFSGGPAYLPGVVGAALVVVGLVIQGRGRAAPEPRSPHRSPRPLPPWPRTAGPRGGRSWGGRPERPAAGSRRESPR